MELLIENIKHQLGDVQFHYNIHISNGITGIFGCSGAGKTTLMNIICGIETPSSGRLVFNNRVLFDKEMKIKVPENKRNIGVVFQGSYLFPHLNIRQNLMYSTTFFKKKKSAIVFDKLVELLDIAPLLPKKPLQLSGGECQRVAIGRTLLSQPELLLLDEPFSNLDRNMRKNIISYLLKINHQLGIPMLIISHDLPDILKLTGSLLIIHKGKVHASGHYLEIAGSEMVPELISLRYYSNIFELYHSKYIEEDDLHAFCLLKHSDEILLKTNSIRFKDSPLQGNKVRFCLFPDDIALNNEYIPELSMQNQILGTVSHLQYFETSCFVSVNCGIPLVVEVTIAAVRKLNIKAGKPIFCLFKAKAVEVIHIYKNLQ